MNTRLFVVTCLALAAMSCTQPVNPHVQWPPGADWDGKPPVCSAQCDNLVQKGCPEGRTSCLKDCETLTEKGLWTSKDTHCVAQAKDLTELKACRVKCEAP